MNDERINEEIDEQIAYESKRDILCDLYDIRNMSKLTGFGDLPKDNEGTETTINDCIENCIQILERNS